MQEKVPKVKHGMVTQTGSQHAHNEDRGRTIIDLLKEFPSDEEVWHVWYGM